MIFINTYLFSIWTKVTKRSLLKGVTAIFLNCLEREASDLYILVISCYGWIILTLVSNAAQEVRLLDKLINIVYRKASPPLEAMQPDSPSKEAANSYNINNLLCKMDSLGLHWCKWAEFGLLQTKHTFLLHHVLGTWIIQNCPTVSGRCC